MRNWSQATFFLLITILLIMPTTYFLKMAVRYEHDARLVNERSCKEKDAVYKPHENYDCVSYDG